MKSSFRIVSTMVVALTLLAAPWLTAEGQGGGPGGTPGGGGGQSGGRGGGGGGGGGGEEEEGYGNNLSVPAVFAEGYGLLGLPTTGLGGDAGLRPRPEDPMSELLEYFDPAGVYWKDGSPYYPQQTTSHWQAQWRNGVLGTPEPVIVNWSDNLTKQRWTARSVVRVETVLYQNPVDTMMAYTMQYLFGKGSTEMWGTNTITYPSTYRTVYSVAARLKIEKLQYQGGPVDSAVPTINESIYESFGAEGGEGGYAAEVNVSGNLIYGYNWMLKQLPATTAQKVGWWRITFQLDPTAVYTVTPESGVPVNVTVPRNATFVDIDAGDKTEVLFVPTVADFSSVLEIEITERREPRKPANPGGGEP